MKRQREFHFRFKREREWVARFTTKPGARRRSRLYWIGRLPDLRRLKMKDPAYNNEIFYSNYREMNRNST